MLAAILLPVVIFADIHTASRACDLAGVREALREGANPNSVDVLGATPLHNAAWCGDADLIKLLLAYKANPNAAHPETGSTPLHYAVLMDRRAAVEALLAGGAQVKTVYRNGTTALHVAANRGAIEIARMLLAKGADVDVRDKGGVTPLEEASWHGEAAMGEFLIAHGAQVNARNPNTGQTALHAAAIKGHTDFVRMLLNAKADTSLRDNNGVSALDEALKNRQPAVITLLMEREKVTPQQLADAVNRGQLDVIELLISKGVDLNAPTRNGSTLLHEAALRGHRAICERLIAAGMDVNARNTSGTTALQEAALAGKRETVAVLLDAGARIDDTEPESGGSALHLAAGYGRKDVVAYLLSRGANKNLKNKNGRLPIDLAAEAGFTDIVALLR